jgi:hypothetical protein
MLRNLKFIGTLVEDQHSAHSTPLSTAMAACDGLGICGKERVLGAVIDIDESKDSTNF